MAQVSQNISQNQDKEIVRYDKCLVVSRHKLLEIQESDVRSICGQYDIVPELPVDAQKLKEAVSPYTAVIGVFPLMLQIQILQNNKSLVVFIMESLGVADDKQQAEQLMLKYPDRSVMLTPSRNGEKFRVLVYKGLKVIKEIRVVDEWLIQHSS